MPAERVHVQDQVDVAFLGYPDHSYRPIHPPQQAVRQGAAFIQHEIETDTLAFEILRNPACTVQATDLFVMTKRQVNRAPWPDTIGQQRLHGLHQCNNTDLVIHAAAAPDDAIRDYSGKRRMRPLVAAILFNGNHVEVTHEQHRFQVGIRTRQVIDQAIAVDHDTTGSLMHAWIARLQEIVKTSERFRVELLPVVVRHRGKGQRLRKALHSRCLIDLQIGVSQGGFELPVLEHRRRSIQHHREQDDHQNCESCE